MSFSVLVGGLYVLLGARLCLFRGLEFALHISQRFGLVGDRLGVLRPLGGGVLQHFLVVGLRILLLGLRLSHLFREVLHEQVHQSQRAAAAFRLLVVAAAAKGLRRRSQLNLARIGGLHLRLGCHVGTHAASVHRRCAARGAGRDANLDGLGLGLWLCCPLGDLSKDSDSCTRDASGRLSGSKRTAIVQGDALFLCELALWGRLVKFGIVEFLHTVLGEEDQLLCGAIACHKCRVLLVLFLALLGRLRDGLV